MGENNTLRKSSRPTRVQYHRGILGETFVQSSSETNSDLFCNLNWLESFFHPWFPNLLNLNAKALNLLSSSKTFNPKCFVQSSCRIKETLCLEQAVLRTTSAPESLRQCFMLAGGWEEQRGTAREVIDLPKCLASVEILKMMGCYLPQLQPSRSPTVLPHVDHHLGQGGQP